MANSFPASGNAGSGTATPDAQHQINGDLSITHPTVAGRLYVNMGAANQMVFSMTGAGGIGAFMTVGPGNSVDYTPNQIKSTQRGAYLRSTTAGIPGLDVDTAKIGTLLGQGSPLGGQVAKSTGTGGGYGSNISAEINVKYDSTQSFAAGEAIIVVTFPAALPNNCIVTFSPSNSAAAKLGPIYVSSMTPNGFKLNTANAQSLTGGVFYNWTVIVSSI